MSVGLIPGTYDPRFVRVFTAYARRLVRGRFAGLRLVSSTRPVLEDLADTERPVILLVNHCSWWDPIIGFVLCRALLPQRITCAPMEASQLQRFRFMRRLGAFGIDPDDPSSLGRMRDWVLERFAKDQRPTLALTPQGRFTDVREPIRIRPGAAAIAARADGVRVASLAIEYPFWQDQRPEALVRAAPCRAERPTTAAWHRAMQQTMQDNADALAALATARDPAPFMAIGGEWSGRINPVYDLWLRLRGRGGGIAARRRSGQT